MSRTVRMNPILSSSSNLQLVGSCWLLLLSVLYPTDGLCQGVEGLINALKDKRPHVRGSALESKMIVSCYTHDPDEETCTMSKEEFDRLTLALIELLRDPVDQNRERAVRYLSESTDARTIGPIARLLRDSNASVRAAAAEAFIHTALSGEAIVRDLEALLLDKDKRVRKSASMALILNGTQRSLDALENAYHRETDPEVKKLLKETVTQLDRRLNRKRP